MGSLSPDFAEFYRGARDECLRAVLVSVGDRDLAQELVDEAFARACASWRKVGKHPAPAAWVVRTALNESISRWRRRRREVAVADPGTLADRPTGDGAGGGGAGGGAIDPRIMAALLRLPARQRQVVALRVFLDLDTDRTAEVLGVTPSTVKAHLARALGALRDDLIPSWQEYQ
jgi:RNA polymerase sigma factor (sigma-70 family)